MRRSAPPLENHVGKILNEMGFVEVGIPRFEAAQALEQPLWVHQYPAGKDIYRKSRKVDFVIYHPEQRPNLLAIQCRSQQRSGTTEQKLPFEVQSIQIGEYDTIVVLEGSGFSLGARQWMSEQAGRDRLRHVISCSELPGILLQNPWR